MRVCLGLSQRPNGNRHTNHTISATRTASEIRISVSERRLRRSNPLFTMHGDQEMLGSRLARGQHRLYDDAVRRRVVGCITTYAVGLQQLA